MEKEPTVLDNRLDMIGEGDGNVKDDPQVWGLPNCVHDGAKV